MKRDQDGRFHFVSRVDDQVKVNGFRIELGEVESQMLSISQVEMAAAIKLDTDDGHCLKIFYKSDTPIDEQKIRQHLKSQLPHYAIPSLFERIHRIPVTPSGKIDRLALKDISQPSNKVESGQNREDLSSQIQGLMTEILGIKLEKTDSFFLLGGTSVQAIKLAQKFEDKTGLPLSPIDIFELQTPEKIAGSLENETAPVKNVTNPTGQANEDRDIAIVGMAGRFPGADNIAALWKLLLEGKDTASTFTAETIATGEDLRDAELRSKTGNSQSW